MGPFPLDQTGIQNALSVTTATALSLTLPTANVPTTHAIIQVNNNSVRWRADGTAPTATAGILVAAGANIEFMDPLADYQAILRNFKVIGISGTASLECAFFAG